MPSTRSWAPPSSTARSPEPAVATLVAYSNQAEHTSGVKIVTCGGGVRRGTNRGGGWGQEGQLGVGVGSRGGQMGVG